MAYGRKVFWHTILAAEIAPVCYRDTEIVNLSAVRINHIIKPTFLKILLQLYQRCSPKYICKETLQLEAILVLSEFWVLQEKVDMKVSAFSFASSYCI